MNICLPTVLRISKQKQRSQTSLGRIHGISRITKVREIQGFSEKIDEENAPTG